MESWMDGWMGGWVGGWMDGWMGGWMGGWMDGWMGGCGGWLVDGWIGGSILEGRGNVTVYKHLLIGHLYANLYEVSSVTGCLGVLVLFSAKLLEDRVVPSFLSPMKSIAAPGWAQCYSPRQTKKLGK